MAKVPKLRKGARPNRALTLKARQDGAKNRLAVRHWAATTAARAEELEMIGLSEAAGVLRRTSAHLSLGD